MNLLFHQGALGDWVLTFPVLRALAVRGAAAGEVTAAVTGLSKAKLAARLIVGLEAINLEGPEWSALHAEGGAAWTGPRVKETLAKATLIVSFVSAADNSWAANVRTLAPHARCVFVAPNPPASWRKPVGQWHLQQLAEQSLPLEPPAIELRSNPNGPIVIHPGSGGLKKCWPAERFEAVIEALRQRSLPVRVILGEVEFAKWPPGTLERWAHAYGAQGSGSLDDLYAALESARLYLGNDSGPTHLAAQMGVPTVALFGPTSAKVWAPQGPAVRVLAPKKLAAMEWLDAAAVVEQINACLTGSFGD